MKILPSVSYVNRLLRFSNLQLFFFIKYLLSKGTLSSHNTIINTKSNKKSVWIQRTTNQPQKKHVSLQTSL